MRGGLALLMPAVAKEMAGKGKDEEDDETDGDGASSEVNEELEAAAQVALDAIEKKDAKALAKALKLAFYCCSEE